jgi:hypothetical protein
VRARRGRGEIADRERRGRRVMTDFAPGDGLRDGLLEPPVWRSTMA